MSIEAEKIQAALDEYKRAEAGTPRDVAFATLERVVAEIKSESGRSSKRRTL